MLDSLALISYIFIVMDNHMKPCKYCNNSIPNDAMFCLYCLHEQAEPVVLSVSSTKSIKWHYAIFTVLFALSLIAGYLLFYKKNDPLSLPKSYVTATKFDSGYQVDLDGDGLKDTIEYEDTKDHLWINGTSYDTSVIDYSSEYEYTLYTGDIDTEDTYIEIFLCEFQSDINWLYAYRFDGESLLPYHFTYTLPSYKSASGSAEDITASIRAWLPWEPILLFGDNRIGWLNQLADSGSGYTYHIFSADNLVFEEKTIQTEHPL